MIIIYNKKTGHSHTKNNIDDNYIIRGWKFPEKVSRQKDFIF